MEDSVILSTYTSCNIFSVECSGEATKCPDYSDTCILKSDMCNGYSDCDNGDDELNCSMFFICFIYSLKNLIYYNDHCKKLSEHMKRVKPRKISVFYFRYLESMGSGGKTQ